MSKLNIAVFFGGCSSEYGVSLQSAAAVMDAIDPARYAIIAVGIAPNGDWLYYPGGTQAIREDRWRQDPGCVPALLSPRRGVHELLLLGAHGVKSLPVDAAFPILHGKNGEDGTIQGLIELAGIPLVGCGTLASALCMDKDRAHRLAMQAGVRAPRSKVIHEASPLSRAEDFAREAGYPIFVKPVRSGSSFGVTRVTRPEELPDARQRAFAHDREVILEENIDGFEVGCAVLGNKTLLVGDVDEIELSGGFFDFEEKYTLKTSAIHVPARVPDETAGRIRQTAMTLYRALGCSGFARVDMFLTPRGEIVFNEINTIPGFTAHSRYPGMMRSAGYSFEEIVEKLIQEAVSEACAS